MTQARNIREGMQVYGANDQLLGTVERVQGDGFDVAGYHFPMNWSRGSRRTGSTCAVPA